MRLRAAPIDSLTIDDLTFAVRWSKRRRTVGITVKRDGGLVVAAPAGTSARKLDGVVRAKLPWVRRKLAEFEALGPPPQPKRFVDGEKAYPWAHIDMAGMMFNTETKGCQPKGAMGYGVRTLIALAQGRGA